MKITEFKDRILIKLEELDSFLSKFNDITPSSESEYLSSLKNQLALERFLQICIEIIIDIGYLMIKYHKLGVPFDEENVFDKLSEKFESIEKYKSMKRFRNVLVHKYGDIDSKKVYYFATKQLNDFYTFIDEVKTNL